MILLKGQNVILQNKITKINAYIYTNILKKKLGGAIAPRSINASIPASLGWRKLAMEKWDKTDQSGREIIMIV